MARSTSPTRTAALPGTADAVEAAFYEGLQTGDLEKVMACWADEDDVACVHPGGPRLLGLATIRASFEALFANGGALHIVPECRHRLDAAVQAIHHVVEHAEVVTEQGIARAEVVATNVYLKTAAGWRLVLHHASPAVAGQAAEVTTVPKILH